MEYTTVKLKPSSKTILAKHKQGSDSFEKTILRLCGEEVESSELSEERIIELIIKYSLSKDEVKDMVEVGIADARSSY